MKLPVAHEVLRVRRDERDRGGALRPQDLEDGQPYDCVSVAAAVVEGASTCEFACNDLFVLRLRVGQDRERDRPHAFLCVEKVARLQVEDQFGGVLVADDTPKIS
ncbi:MAG TPA: hypothetical protein VM580_10630 [Labilithrix sp.]|jgi:hypothetical protein|nr:hypothetical protein [Labilithrix sp.]